MKYVVDTCVFNWLAKGRVAPSRLPRSGTFVATHIQRDELGATPSEPLRASLLALFTETVAHNAPTESAVVGVSRVGGCKLSDGSLFGRLKQALDACNGSKRNNSRDALIAEVAIMNEWVLLTADGDLAQVALANDCAVRLLLAQPSIESNARS